MAKLLLVLAVLALAHLGSSNKCNSSIINGIYKLWQGKTSTGLLKTLNDAGYCVVVASVTGLIPEEDSIQCFRTTFHNDVVQNIWHFKNNTKKEFPKFTVRDVYKRYLYTDETKVHRYYLPFDQKDGVATFYICEDEGEVGHPRASIAVFSNTYSKKKLEEYIQDWSSLGIEMTNTYPDTCP